MRKSISDGLVHYDSAFPGLQSSEGLGNRPLSIDAYVKEKESARSGVVADRHPAGRVQRARGGGNSDSEIDGGCEGPVSRCSSWNADEGARGKGADS